MLGSDSFSANGVESIGFSPHIVEEVAKEGAAHSYLRPGDEIASLDGKIVVSMDYKAVRQLLAQAAELKSSIRVAVIRRQHGDNWGLTSRRLQFEIPLTNRGPTPTHIDERLQHTSSAPEAPSLSSVSNPRREHMRAEAINTTSRSAASAANSPSPPDDENPNSRPADARPVCTPIGLRIGREEKDGGSGAQDEKEDKALGQRRHEPTSAAEFWSSVAAPLGSVIGQGLAGNGRGGTSQASAVPPPRSASRPDMLAAGHASENKWHDSSEKVRTVERSRQDGVSGAASIQKVYVPAIFRSGEGSDEREAGQGRKAADRGDLFGTHATRRTGGGTASEQAKDAGSRSGTAVLSDEHGVARNRVSPGVGMQAAAASTGAAGASTPLAAYLLRMPASASVSTGRSAKGSSDSGGAGVGDRQLKEVANWQGKAGGDSDQGQGAGKGTGAKTGPSAGTEGTRYDDEVRGNPRVPGPQTPTGKPGPESSVGGGIGPRRQLAGEQGWGGMGGWPNAQGLSNLQLQDLQMGLQQGFQQLQQSVVMSADSAVTAGGHSGAEAVRAGGSGAKEEDDAMAEAARRKAEDAEAAAQQLRLERVDAIAKGYVPVKQLTDADKRLLWRYRKRLVGGRVLKEEVGVALHYRGVVVAWCTCSLRLCRKFRPGACRSLHRLVCLRALASEFVGKAATVKG